MEFLATVLAAFLGSGAGAAVVTWLMNRDEHKRERLGSTSDTARDHLADLDAAYRAIAGGGDVGDLTDIEAGASAQVDKCGSESLSRKYDEWQAFGRRFASRDEDAGEEEYSQLFDEVRGELRSAIEKLT